MSKNFLYRMLNKRAYIGEAVHKGMGYAGEHERLIDQKIWDNVQSILQQSPRLRANNTRSETPTLLKGLFYGPDGAAFSPTHTRKGDRLYRYYVSQTVLKHGAGEMPGGTGPGGRDRGCRYRPGPRYAARAGGGRGNLARRAARM